MKIAFHADWVFPVTAPPLRHGFLTIEEGVVGEGVVAEVASSAPSGVKLVELGQVAILPRAVNAHTHLEFSDLAKPLGEERQSFSGWIGKVLEQRSQRPTSKATSIEKGLQELANAMTIGVGEIATHPSSAAEYAKAEASGVAFQEVLSTDYDRGIERLAQAVSLGDAWPAAAPLRFGLSPHAPYSVEWRLFQKMVETAMAKQWPLAMHLGESFEELELLRSHSGKMRQFLVDRGVWNPSATPRGIRLADYLVQLAKAPRALAIHGNYLDDEEHELLARHRDRMSLVICPRTCDYFLPKLPPIAELLAKGIHIAIGTDSRATNPDLNLWNEARFLLANAPDLAPAEVLRLATRAGAESLGLGAEYGRIGPGVPLKHLAFVPVVNVENQAQSAMESAMMVQMSQAQRDEKDAQAALASALLGDADPISY